MSCTFQDAIPIQISANEIITGTAPLPSIDSDPRGC